MLDQGDGFAARRTRKAGEPHYRWIHPPTLADVHVCGGAHRKENCGITLEFGFRPRSIHVRPQPSTHLIVVVVSVGSPCFVSTTSTKSGAVVCALPAIQPAITNTAANVNPRAMRGIGASESHRGCRFVAFAVVTSTNLPDVDVHDRNPDRNHADTNRSDLGPYSVQVTARFAEKNHGLAGVLEAPDRLEGLAVVEASLSDADPTVRAAAGKAAATYGAAAAKLAPRLRAALDTEENAIVRGELRDALAKVVPK